MDTVQFDNQAGHDLALGPSGKPRLRLRTADLFLGTIVFVVAVVACSAGISRLNPALFSKGYGNVWFDSDTASNYAMMTSHLLGARSTVHPLAGLIMHLPVAFFRRVFHASGLGAVTLTMKLLAGLWASPGLARGRCFYLWFRRHIHSDPLR
jgi:hypothetical protein